MANAILKVLVVLLVIVYCALFITWNSQLVTVAGLDWFGDRYVQDMPAGYLPLIGAVAGALFMAIMASAAWGAQKGQADRAVAQVAKAKTKLQELADLIKQQRQEIAQLRGGPPEEPQDEQPSSAPDEEDQ